MNKININQLDISSLQDWFLKNQRDLPFRKTKNPYTIWVSEVMLQQTKMETVIPYYNHFMENYPDVFSLAKATQEALLKVVEGIGYYRRFKLMIKAANTIVDHFQGVFPSTYKEILSLPGIGKYTAGAMMSIAFNQPYAATDGNVIRVLSRAYNISKDMRVDKNRNLIDQLNQSMIETVAPNIYTESLMELGALICLPKKPLCNNCPLCDTCLAFKNSTQEMLPVISKLPDKKEVHYISLIVHEKHQIYVRKRTEMLLQGMYEYPQIIAKNFNEAKRLLENEGVHISLLYKDKTYKHVFTHLKWVMDVYHVQLISGNKSDWMLVDLNDLSLYPMATAHRQINLL